MPIEGPKQIFVALSVGSSPERRGVYALYDRNHEVIYYGAAGGRGATIRSRLRSHHRGDEGECTRDAWYFNYEITRDPYKREAELLDEYRRLRFGQVPLCNGTES